MKGPGGRSRFQVYRLWECPRCRRREYTGGEVVNRRCSCTAKEQAAPPTWMLLIEEQPQPIQRCQAATSPPADGPSLV